MSFSRLTLGHDWPVWLAVAVYAALCSVGIFSGGAYSGIVIGLAVVLLVAGLARGEGMPALDRPLVALAVLFAVLCWASALWSIVPERTVRGALQVTGVFAGVLVLLAEKKLLRAGASLILTAALFAAILGETVTSADFLLGHPIMRHVAIHSASGGAVNVKFDRGLSYLAILLWPILAHAWQSGRRMAAVAAVILAGLALALGVSSSAQLAFLAALVALLIAARLPALVVWTAGIVGAALALATPFAVRAIAARLSGQAAAIKPSFGHRLEIWDYMSARVMERPLTGWGWWSADALPITPDELARYRYVGAAGSAHPHNNWLQLWVEGGAGGAVLGFLLLLLVLTRIRRLPRPHAPFALASLAAALIISLGSFDLATDSWWCCLAATGLLFTILPEPTPPLPEPAPAAPP